MSGVRTLSSLILAAFLAPTPGSAAEAEAAKLRARVDAYLGPLVEARLFSGSVLLALDGEVVAEAGYGKAHEAGDVANTPATRFKLMSVSKPFTALAVMSLLEDGKLGLGDPAAKHLEAWPAAWDGVTVRHLLGHTSGIPNLELEWTKLAAATGKRGLELWPRLAARVGDRALDSPPGDRSSYSNFNYVLLGFVVEARSGQPYANYVRSAVLDVAGMEGTGFDDGSRPPGLAMGYFRGRGGALEESRQDMSMIQAAGGLYSTVLDLYRLDRALYRDELLSAPTRALMWTPVAQGYACGWQVTRTLGRPSIRHSGGANGFVAEFLRFPEEDAAVVVLSNFAFAPLGRISRDLAALLFGEPYEAPRRVPPERLSAYAGTYRMPAQPGRRLLFRRSGDALLLFDVDERTDRAAGNLLFPIASDTFATPWGEGRIRFDADESDRVRRGFFGMGPTVLEMERAASARGAWRGLTGRYRVNPPSGPVLAIVEEEGRLLMRGPGVFPEAELVPVSERRAIALIMETFGTMLRIDRTDGPGGPSFEWHRADGVKVRGFREPR